MPNPLRHQSLDFRGVVISLSPFTRFYQCLVGRLKTTSPRLTVVCTLELSTGSALAYRKQVPSRSSVSVARLSSLSYIAIHTTVVLRISPQFGRLYDKQRTVWTRFKPGHQGNRCRDGVVQGNVLLYRSIKVVSVNMLIQSLRLLIKTWHECWNLLKYVKKRL